MSDHQYEAILAGQPDFTANLRIVTPEFWKKHVIMRDGCAFHDDPHDCELPFQAHHIITQQQLRKRGMGDHLWDVRNGMGLCYAAHRRHTLAVERIPFEFLSGDAHEFAAERGLSWLLDRYYPRRKAA